VSLLSLLGSGGISGFDSKPGAAPRPGDADLLDGAGGLIHLDIEEIDAAADAKTLDDMLAALDLKDPPAQAQAKSGLAGAAAGGAWGGSGAKGAQGAGAKAQAQAQAQAKGAALEDEEDDLLALMDAAK